ncbi:hypothetical protein [Bacillus thuringiensis]|uniref:hypothetical protein n=1 Tax=Bacillus thuringiensis TaxID=1428 RepID=UPI000BF418ED|nr:hypothetical protein [Bacillus thuringiensis]MDA2251876.1 hypothetical protein [Bacillus cereus]MDA2279831.1 hypothetical protein [Bacillus cereus]MDA2285445.1 hypothetical protein [Bacillus cereus]MDA2296373.1 hypothetical protein [Bacillus cereus]MED3269582.1 hypothetical protein [Bacillus thuringiensis]
MESIKELNKLLLGKAKKKINESKLGVSLKIEEIGDGSNAAYDKYEHSIKVNLRLIISGSRDEGINPEDYLEIVLCHELGHVIDPDLTFEEVNKIKAIKEKLNDGYERLDSLNVKDEEYIHLRERLNNTLSELKKIEYPAEIRACHLGRRFVPDHLVELYDKHREGTLKTYLASYE